MSMQPTIPAGTESARPFVPAADFDRSKRFYETLGFEKLVDGEVAIFRIGSSGFILQRYDKKAFASNFMMQLMVDDPDAWWMHITALICRGSSSAAAEGAGDAAMGAAGRVFIRSRRCALACSPTTRGGAAGLTTA